MKTIIYKRLDAENQIHIDTILSTSNDKIVSALDTLQSKILSFHMTQQMESKTNFTCSVLLNNEETLILENSPEEILQVKNWYPMCLNIDIIDTKLI